MRLIELVARSGLLGAVAGAAGCDGPATPTPAGRVAFATAGDQQIGLAGDRLPVALAVAVRDDRGRPAADVPVAWVLAVNGVVAPEGAATGADGLARAEFTLGPMTGPASVVAVVDGVDSVYFRFSARAPEEVPLPFDQYFNLSFTTFDDSGETVHPDHARVPWALPRRLAITPYPGGNAGFELPSVFAGRTAERWALAPGAPNPVVGSPPFGHHSDPDLVWNPERQEAWLYYREASNGNPIWLTTSTDGVQWSTPVKVITVPSHELISPAVVRRAAGDWWMWSINGGPVGCSAAAVTLEVRRSTDGVAWGPPTALALAHDGLYPWHVDVAWIESRQEYWAVYNAKKPGSCTTPALFLARSPDGLAWTPVRTPLVAKGDDARLRDIVYRASFEYLPAEDRLALWVSGARYDAGRWTWSTVLINRRAGDALDTKAHGPPEFAAPPAELIDWP
ncbi:MAG: hypothetical protein JNJ80_26640 [Gemmatimonadetes bacterium]|nr:hypothetical protein [Gemmatimonadota bacterium]